MNEVEHGRAGAIVVMKRVAARLRVQVEHEALLTEASDDDIEQLIRIAWRHQFDIDSRAGFVRDLREFVRGFDDAAR